MNEAAASTTPSRDFTGVTFALLAAIGSAIILSWLATLCRIMPERTLLGLAALAILGIFFVAGPILVLAYLLTILFDTPGHLLGVLPSFGNQLSFAEMALSATYIVYAWLCYRFQHTRTDWKRRTRSNESPASASMDAADWLTVITVGFVLATAARWMVPFLYAGRAMAGSMRLVPAVAGFLVALVLLSLGSWLWIILVRTAGRGTMTSLQARVVLEDTLDQELGSELQSVARRVRPTDEHSSLFRSIQRP